jgi:hypothetical protein
VSAQYFIAKTVQNDDKDCGWKSPAVVRPSWNHDGQDTTATPVATRTAAPPITVVNGPITPEQIHALINGQ